jgi:hypothetical protein
VTTGPPTHAREHTMTATATTAPRFVGVRAEGRYRVQDTLTGEYVAICASKAKAAYAAERLNAQEAEATPFTAEENAALAADEAAWEAQQDAPAVDRAQQAIDDARAHLAAHPELVDPADEELAAALQVTTGANELPAEMVHEHRAYRIGKVLREFVLAAEKETYPAALVEHIASRNVCYDGTATLRLCFIDATDLSRAATDLENAALSGEFQAKAPAVMAARAARKSLAKLF